MRVRRRTILFASVASVTAIAGCLGDEPTDDENESTNGEGQNDEKEAHESIDHEIPEGGSISVLIEADISDDVPILNATEESLLEDEHIETALEEADDEYEPGMKDELDPEDRWGSELVTNWVDTNDEFDATIETLGRDNQANTHQWYVEYNETRYMIRVEWPPEPE